MYRALLSLGGLNGYEIAKELGISRSNAYTSLASLVEKGAAWLADGSPARYVPVPPEEFCGARIAALERGRAFLVSVLPERKPEPGVFITIQGRERIFDRLCAMLAESSERIYLAAAWKDLQSVAGALADCGEKGLKLVILTDREALDSGEPGRRLPRAVFHAAEPGIEALRCIADSKRVLTGDLGGPDPSCLYSDQKNFAELFKTALKNEIRLSRIDRGEADR